jgi:anthranilate phosphoribosyltransferase
VGALLVMLRQRGETPAEIAGMVRAMKKACRPVNVRHVLNFSFQ